jgi:hypothetical protein
VAHQIVISGGLSARLNQSDTPIWDVIRFHNNKSLLHDLTIYYGVTKKYPLTTYYWIGKSIKAIDIILKMT